MKAFEFAVTLASAALLAVSGGSALAQTKVKLEKVAGGIDTLLAMMQPPGDRRMFVIEQNGRVKIIENGKLDPTPFLDIRSKIVPLLQDFDERGLLGLAFHPKFKEDGKFCVACGTHLDDQPDPGPDALVQPLQRGRGVHRLGRRQAQRRSELGPAHHVQLLAAVQPQRPLHRLRPRRHAVRVHR